jgi:hypothetical protein
LLPAFAPGSSRFQCGYGGDQSSIHRPQSCIPVQGWSIERPHRYELTFNRLADSKTLVVDGQPIPVESSYPYWYTADGKITSQLEGGIVSTAWPMSTAGEAWRRAYLAAQVAFPEGAGELVYPRAKGLARQAVPEFQLATGAAEASQ